MKRQILMHILNELAMRIAHAQDLLHKGAFKQTLDELRLVKRQVHRANRIAKEETDAAARF